MLLGMDILGPEKIDIVLSQGHAVIGSCQSLQIPIGTQSHGKQVYSKVRAATHTILQPRSAQWVAVDHSVHQDDGQDLLFTPTGYRKSTSYSHLADCNMTHILVEDETDDRVQIARGARLGHLSSIPPDACVYRCEAEMQ